MEIVIQFEGDVQKTCYILARQIVDKLAVATVTAIVKVAKGDGHVDALFGLRQIEDMIRVSKPLIKAAERVVVSVEGKMKPLPKR